MITKTELAPFLLPKMRARNSRTRKALEMHFVEGYNIQQCADKMKLNRVTIAKVIPVIRKRMATCGYTHRTRIEYYQEEED